MRCVAIWNSVSAPASTDCLRSPCLLRLPIPPGDLVKLIQNYIDGRFVSGEREFADVNPADGTVIAQVTEAGKAQVNEAVHAARVAMRGEWGRLAEREPAAQLH